MEFYKSYMKRLIDLILSFVAFLIALPILILVFILIIIFNKSNPFFTQSRPGKNEKIFKVIKFKTMNDKRDIKGNLLPDAERLTPIGKFVRKTSLDELPQLINVLKGDMSLIGPRPLLIEYLALYNKTQQRRHEVRPGITGWAQVNGRNSISWKKKFEYDVWYVNNISFILDIEIIFMTIKKVIKSDGINDEGHATKEAFSGNN
ncbi:MAG: sugar transferase [Candidatus Cloacimonetes bacterium]|jgi:undecaprenyl phosphate N,N'-diacetylbacillosamine 1-phosphate transferase|nr:sugar transferase [Candidatus Cloacimonadota bacterium]